MGFAPVATPAAVRQLYLPNGYDTFGVSGVLAGKEDLTNTDTTLNTHNNIAFGGYGTNQGTVDYQIANPVAGRPLTVRLRTGAVSGNQANFRGIIPLSTTLRLTRVPVANWSMAGYTKWVAELFAVLPSIADVDAFLGLWDQGGADPLAAGSKAVGAIYQPSTSANWQTVANNAGSITKTAGSVAAATAVTRLKVEVSSAAVQVTVDGTLITSVTANLPSTNLWPMLAIFTRTAAAKDLHIEEIVDRGQ